MNQTGKRERVLGAAFLLQAVTSLISGAFLFQPLIDDDSIAISLKQIALSSQRVYGGILIDTVTALGIIFLASTLYIYLKEQNRLTALSALGFYIMEAAVLAFSKSLHYGLILISEKYAARPSTELETMAEIVLKISETAYTLHLLPFIIGAMIFYYLMFRTKLVPTAFSLWGMISLVPFYAGVPLMMFGLEFPFVFFLPYVPFEFTIGLWILVRGIIRPYE